ncbi:MAG: glycosyltransferase [Bacilli bacterium]|nr:glycosyltransferase [Bacilli bacterium]
MKLLTITVPCYNSAAYMNKCIDKMLEVDHNDIEIIIVNDGSKDETLLIAKKYEEQYPDVVRVIDKENGGHGSGVNAGIANATGVYFRVCDSDDYLEPESLKKLLAVMKKAVEENNEPDVIFTNYVYDHAYDNTYRTNSLSRIMPKDRIFTWDEMKAWKVDEYTLMHSINYKTSIIRESKMVLPEHCFYVDEIYCYTPLFYCKKLYYMEIPLYWYFIGRPDQSVTLENMKKRYKMQLTVVENMFGAYTYEQLKTKPKKLRKYMIHTLRIMTTVATAYVYFDKGKQRRRDYREFKKRIKASNPSLYKRIFHFGYTIISCNLPFFIARPAYAIGYRITAKTLKVG